MTMEFLVRDLRFAARALRKHPAFTATVVATLALAIGVGTAIFSVVDATLLRSLPFANAGRIVVLDGVFGPEHDVRGASYMEIGDWAALNRTVDRMALYDGSAVSLRTTDGTERLAAEFVSSPYFSVLGAAPQIGRVFTADDDRTIDASPVAVIGDGLWRTRFGSDRSIVGRVVTINDKPFTVVGVMKPGFAGMTFDTDIWVPASMGAIDGGNLTSRGSRYWNAVGVLKPGVSLGAAQADLDRVGRQLAAQYPDFNKDRGALVRGLRDSYLGDTSRMLLAVFGAVGLLILIACANVISLQLVRAAGRRREIALRIAIGADRARIARQLLAEGVVIAAASATFGVLAGWWTLRGLTGLVPDGLLPGYVNPSMNIAALAFAIVAAAICGMIVGLTPSIGASRIALGDALRQGSRGSAGGFGRGWRLGPQQLLVVGESAIALTLLVAAGLYARSLQRQLLVEPGYTASRITRARVALPARYPAAERVQVYDRLESTLSQANGIKALALGSNVPLGGGSSASFLMPEGSTQSVRFYWHAVSPSYFAVLRIPVTAGRTFTRDDGPTTERVGILNASAARRLFARTNPVGKHVMLGNTAVTIVGIVGDVRYRDLTTPLGNSEPDLYLPLTQRAVGTVELVVQSDLPAGGLADVIRRSVASVDPSMPVYGISQLEKLLARQTSSGRFASTMLGAFGAGALLLAAIGLYGVLAFLVSLRRRELGIRVALGATPDRVRYSVVLQGLRLVGLGTVCGLFFSSAISDVVAANLYGVSAHDPLVFAGVPAVLLAIAVLAAWLPAQRASQVDPQIALRAD
jgi:putative ABC transport system permease protein